MKRLIFSVFFLLIILIVPKAHAAMDPETRVQIDRIERDLTEIKQTQQQLLDGQKRLSEEHAQLRQWIYRR